MLRHLFKKEIHLQKSNLYFVLAIILVWGILLALATRAEVKFASPGVTMGVVVCLLQVGFVGFCLLAVVPLLVGAAMVAEERKLAVWEWQLSLPCPRRTQWAMKLAVGSAITLALTLVVQPLLDFLLSRVMGSYASGILLPSAFLGTNEIYRTFPLLLMMSAAFVSSMSKDPYKAFFLGIVFFGFILACFSIFDPARLLILPWNLTGMVRSDLKSVEFLVNKHVPWMLGLGLSAGLAALSQFNFRLEGFRWRRFLCQLASVFLLVAAVTWIGLQLEFGVGDLVSQKARDVEPLILHNRSQAPGAGKTVDWAGIDPILVRRAKLPPHTSKLLALREERCWAWQCPTRVIPIPGTGRILVEINSFPVLAESSGQLVPQVVELGIDEPYLRPLLSLYGPMTQVFPEPPGCLIRNWRYGIFLSPHWPLPIKADGLLSRILIRKPLPLDSLSEFYRNYRFGQIKIGERVFQSPQIWPVNMDKGYFELTIRDEVTEGKRSVEKWLIKRDASDTWTVVDKRKPTHYQPPYHVSPDGKWYAPEYRLGLHARDSLTSSLGVYSCDHKTSWILENTEGELIITDNGWQDFITWHDMATRSSHFLRVSPSGRFLPFLRTNTIKLEVDGKELDTRCPEAMEFALLDLQTGQDRLLLRTKPDRAAQKEFQQVMKQWNLWRPRWESGQTGKDEPFRQEGRLITVTGRGVPLHYQKFPPMVWAPDRDALAILFDEKIYLFERRAQTTQNARQENAGQEAASQETAQNAGDFRLLGAVDLTGFQIRDMDFWNGGVMLAWGGTGLYRIDLAKALKPAPPEQ